MNRRSFLTTGLGALGTAALPAIEPIQRRGGPRLVLGLAAYSFRNRMKWMRGMPNAVTTLLLESGVKDLGVHTEMLNDGLCELYRAGRVSGARKALAT